MNKSLLALVLALATTSPALVTFPAEPPPLPFPEPPAAPHSWIALSGADGPAHWRTARPGNGVCFINATLPRSSIGVADPAVVRCDGHLLGVGDAAKLPSRGRRSSLYGAARRGNGRPDAARAPQVAGSHLPLHSFAR